ncbi:hypothetical protein [Evansella tamaricis]|uniref:Uncharacterized protein n=1 Tax=Evansella tamaricis TaxID=2069301 RepID=A0ABS6JHR3_9BACI|nr:hypothetical protein [Evansella tamaricis]MBU9713206.1 hypothetical protein [Evansella tamaricis]
MRDAASVILDIGSIQSNLREMERKINSNQYTEEELEEVLLHLLVTIHQATEVVNHPERCQPLFSLLTDYTYDANRMLNE